jgi:hypothetical protein
MPKLNGNFGIFDNKDKKRSSYNMGELSNSPQKVLPEFQKFLLDRKVIPDKQVLFFAKWVSRFLRFARGRDIS